MLETYTITREGTPFPSHPQVSNIPLRVTAATGIDFPHAAQVFRTVRHAGGLDGQRTRKQVVYGITSLSADIAGPADVAAG